MSAQRAPKQLDDQPTNAVLVAGMAIGARLGQFNPCSESDIKRWVRVMFPMVDGDHAVKYGELVSRMLEARPDWPFSMEQDS